MCRPRPRRPRATLIALLAVAALLAGGAGASPPAARADAGPRLRWAGAGGPLPPAPGPAATPGHGDTPFLALPRAAGPGAPAAPAAARFQPGAAAAPGMAPADAAGFRFGPDVGAQALSAACQPLLGNGAVAAAYDDEAGRYYLADWFVSGPTVTVSDDAYVSYPYALTMTDGDERDGPGPTDYDGFGQAFTMPPDAQSFRFDFQMALVAGTLDAADRSALELYLVGADGGLLDASPESPQVQPLAALSLDPLQRDDGGWTAVRGSLDDPALLAALRGQRAAAVFSQYGNRLGRAEAIFLDNLQATACPTAEPATQSVYGYVTSGGRPTDPADRQQFDPLLTTATVALAYSPDGGQRFEVARVTAPARNGYFEFRDVPPLQPGAFYQAWYVNSGAEDLPGDSASGRLSYATAGPVTSFATFQGLPGTWGYAGIIELADVALTAPAHEAEVAAVATFAWTARDYAAPSSPAAPYRYLVCFYNPNRVANGRYEEVCTTDPVAEPRLTLDSAIFERDVPGFLRPDAVYGWYVRVLAPGYQASPPANLGASRSSRFFTFVPQVEAPVPAPPAESDPPPAGRLRPWTLLFYVSADDPELTFPEQGGRGMAELVTGLSELARRSPDVNVVVQFDLFESDRRPLPSPDLRGTRRCAFQPGAADLDAACQTLGELNMADPQALADFVRAGLERYPGERTALVLVGHGNPAAGVAGDRTAGPEGHDDALGLDELGQALGLAGLDGPGRTLDLVFFQASLLGNYETAAVVAPFADYMVASPNVAPLLDISPEILALAGRQGTTPRALALGIVEAYQAELAAINRFQRRELSLAMAAYDLAQLEALGPQVDALGAALRANLGRPEIRAARQAVQQYDSSAPLLWGFSPAREDGLVDLRHLAALLVSSPSPAVRRAAEALTARGGPLEAAVIASVARSGEADYVAGGSHDLGNAFGMSIFLPNGSELGQQPALTNAYVERLRGTGVAREWVELVAATRLARGLDGEPGDLGSTLQIFAAPGVFPAAAALPPAAPRQVWLPLARR